MTTPSYLNAGARHNSSSATQRSPGLPASRANGNLLLGICGTKNNATHVPQGTAGDDWEPAFTQTNSGSGWTVSGWWRYVDGLDELFIDWTGSAAAFAQVFQFTGVAPTDPIGAVSVNFGTGATHSTSASASTGDNSLMVYLDASAANSTLAEPSGWAERVDNGSSTGSTSNALGDKTVATSGSSSGAISVSGPNAAWVQVQIELLEPVAPGPTNVDGDGSVTTTASATGEGKSIVTTTGSASASAALSGAAQSLNTGNGSAAATASASGEGGSIITGAGSPSGTASATGAGGLTTTATGDAQASSSADAESSIVITATGSCVATSGCESDGSAAFAALGNGECIATSSCSATASSIITGTGEATATSAVEGQGGAYITGVALSAGFGVMVGQGQSIIEATGLIECLSAANGEGSVILPIRKATVSRDTGTLATSRPAQVQYGTRPRAISTGRR